MGEMKHLPVFASLEVQNQVAYRLHVTARLRDDKGLLRLIYGLRLRGVNYEQIRMLMGLEPIPFESLMQDLELIEDDE